MSCGHSLHDLTAAGWYTELSMTKFNKTLGGLQRREPGDSIIPPPRSQDDLRPSRPPRGLRTPSLGQDLPDFEQLPEHAAPWMKRARRLVLALEHAIAGGQLAPGEMAAVERAWSAYELGVTDSTIAKVAHLCERAHGAINQRLHSPARDAFSSCAGVLYAGLPRNVRKHIEQEELIDIVRQMRAEPDPWPAVVDATARILRWDALARQHAGQAVRVALSVENQED